MAITWGENVALATTLEGEELTYAAFAEMTRARMAERSQANPACPDPAAPMMDEQAYLALREGAPMKKAPHDVLGMGPMGDPYYEFYEKINHSTAAAYKKVTELLRPITADRARLGMHFEQFLALGRFQGLSLGTRRLHMPRGLVTRESRGETVWRVPCGVDGCASPDPTARWSCIGECRTALCLTHASRHVCSCYTPRCAFGRNVTNRVNADLRWQCSLVSLMRCEECRARLCWKHVASECTGDHHQGPQGAQAVNVPVVYGECDVLAPETGELLATVPGGGVSPMMTTIDRTGIPYRNVLALTGDRAMPAWDVTTGVPMRQVMGYWTGGGGVTPGTEIDVQGQEDAVMVATSRMHRGGPKGRTRGLVRETREEDASRARNTHRTPSPESQVSSISREGRTPVDCRALHLGATAHRMGWPARSGGPTSSVIGEGESASHQGASDVDRLTPAMLGEACAPTKDTDILVSAEPSLSSSLLRWVETMVRDESPATGPTSVTEEGTAPPYELDMVGETDFQSEHVPCEDILTGEYGDLGNTPERPPNPKRDSECPPIPSADAPKEGPARKESLKRKECTITKSRVPREFPETRKGLPFPQWRIGSLLGGQLAQPFKGPPPRPRGGSAVPPDQGRVSYGLDAPADPDCRSTSRGEAWVSGGPTPKC